MTGSEKKLTGSLLRDDCLPQEAPQQCLTQVSARGR